ncbi:MAG: bifunctional 3-deoxy-7-phosphoheptulonate synthase/chorismate mutase type II [Paludibacteraceae bacterium]|nr:bifunctional 3-deoxy-7-phosphoheptulonate synthase/chorismate mutase type II [Paludibacteraceae bacterium]
MNILGPCSAESREQVIETASRICDLGFQISNFKLIYRAGVWKPRTSPHSFQGAGAEGLAWLQEVKERFGIPVATEVASPEHVRLALEAGIDYLWIGARSSATPIVVQAIADAIGFAISELGISGLKGIIIKNPVNADGDLWLGNIERLEKTGIPVIAVHRGCNHQPCWFMAHQVRLARPDIPMLLDPSHMSGDAAKVPELMKKVAELGLDGAMVEVHNNPSAALSDAAQQIKPEEIVERCTVYGVGCKDTELNWLRAEIDELDEQLWDTIAKRMDVSRRIGAWKKAHDMTPLQPERYREIVERIKSRDESQESRDFMLKIWEIIHEQSLREQE